MWGNFKVGYMGNELAQVDRGLYGANAHYGSEATTSFGERRFAVDGFAARARQRCRATRNSAEPAARSTSCATRTSSTAPSACASKCATRTSGIVTGVVNLRPDMDYDIDYLQGRLLLSEPLSSTADDNLLVRSSGLSGDEA